MRLNPELRRYLWLELSPARLIAMPVVIAALMLLVGAWAFAPGQAMGGPDLLEGMASLGSGGFALLVLFWGARLAANAVVREVADRTWDQQRLSSAGAWSMTWGKLIGSTIFVGYGCLLLLALTLVSLILWQVLYGGVSAVFHAPLWVVLVQVTLGLGAFAVLVLACVMLIAMTAVARRETGRQLDVSIAQIVVIVVAFGLFSSFSEHRGAGLIWYSLLVDALWFAVASALAFAAWAVVGLWRRMRVELQVRNWPVMWPLFVLFAGLWAAGFAEGSGRTVVAAVVVLVAGYVPAVLEQPDPVRLRRLLGALGQRDAATALRFMPLWLVNHVLALVVVAVAALVLLGQGTEAEPAVAPASEFDGLAFAAGTLVSFYLFVTRDLLLLVLAALGRGGRRAFATWLLWMALLYGIAPMILAALGLYASLPVFVPVWDVPLLDFAVPPVVWPLLQVAVVLVLIRWRWRRFALGRLDGPVRQAP